MEARPFALFLAGGLLALGGCGPGGEAQPRAGAEPAKAAQPAKTPAPKAEPETPPPPKKEPEEEPAEASKESVVKVKRLLRRWNSKVEEERREAWQGLKDMGDLATPALIEVVKTGEPAERRFAITAIGLLKDKLGAEALRAALADEDAEVRWSAARALGEIGDGDAKGLLAKAVAGDKNPEVRYHAAYALASLGGGEAFAYFKKQLASEKAEDRSRAVRVLGKYGKGKYVPDLAAALKDKDVRVRRAALIQMDRARKKEAIPGLIAALGDEDYRIRKRARSALERFTGKEFGAEKAKWEAWWDKEGESFKPSVRKTGAEPLQFANAAAIKGEADFKARVTGAKGWVAVDFYSARSRECRTYAPVFDKVAGQYKGRVAMYAAEARANMKTVRELGLRVAPTTIVYKDGKKVETVPGFKEEAELKKILDGHLAGTRKVADPDNKPAFPQAKDAADFKKKVEEAKGVVLVDFHAAWCGWCHKLTPILNELSAEYEGKLAFLSVDTDKTKDLKDKLEIKSWPTMIIFKGGKEAERILGFKKKDALKEIIEKHLAAGGDSK